MPIERTVPLENGTRNFYNSLPPFKRSSYFYITVTGGFEHFHDLFFKGGFLKNESHVSKKVFSMIS